MSRLEKITVAKDPVESHIYICVCVLTNSVDLPRIEKSLVKDHILKAYQHNKPPVQNTHKMHCLKAILPISFVCTVVHQVQEMSTDSIRFLKRRGSKFP